MPGIHIYKVLTTIISRRLFHVGRLDVSCPVVCSRMVVGAEKEAPQKKDRRPGYRVIPGRRQCPTCQFMPIAPIGEPTFRWDLVQTEESGALFMVGCFKETEDVRIFHPSPEQGFLNLPMPRHTG